MTDEELDDRIDAAFAIAPHDARLRYLRDLLLSAGRTPPGAEIAPYRATLTIRRAVRR